MTRLVFFVNSLRRSWWSSLDLAFSKRRWWHCQISWGLWIHQRWAVHHQSLMLPLNKVCCCGEEKWEATNTGHRELLAATAFHTYSTVLRNGKQKWKNSKAAWNYICDSRNSTEMFSHNVTGRGSWASFSKMEESWSSSLGVHCGC